MAAEVAAVALAPPTEWHPRRAPGRKVGCHAYAVCRSDGRPYRPSLITVHCIVMFSTKVVVLKVVPMTQLGVRCACRVLLGGIEQ